jgi:hypothetical protein
MQALTKNSQKKKHPYVYTSFTSILRPNCHINSDLDIENYFGIIRFMNDEKGEDLHSNFVDWCLTNSIKLHSSNLLEWLDLAEWEPGYFEFNFRCWVIETYVQLEVLMGSITKANLDVKKIVGLITA